MTFWEILQAGREEMRKAHFKEAVEQFSIVINQQHQEAGGLMEALEDRSKAYDKLGSDDLALQDGQQMIQQNTTDRRGYLRCASIELRNFHLDSAANFCNEGARNATDGDKYFEDLLWSIEQAVPHKMTLEKARDPFLVLPDPVLRTLVREYLSVQEVTAIMRVSKLWSEYLCSNSRVRSEIKINLAWSDLNVHQLSVLFDRLGPQPTSLEFGRVGAEAVAYIHRQLSQWQRWTSLEQIRFDHVDLDLSQIKWESLGKLRFLAVSNELSMPENIKDIIALLPNLETLQLSTVGPDWGAMDLNFQTDHKSLRQLSVATSGDINEIIVRIPRAC